MRLGANGEIIVETGFDGGNYSPRYEDRTSVFLGDMSKEDLKVRAEIRKRKAGMAAEHARAAALGAAAAKAKVARQDAINRSIQAREAAAERKMAALKSAGYLAARAQSTMESINTWVGSPYAGFGQKGEQRINPDSNESVEIVDMDIPSVKEYGVSNWMEDPSSLEDRVKNSQEAWTTGKELVQTLVDYAPSADRSVVGMPSTTIVPLSCDKENYDAYNAQFAPMGALPDLQAQAMQTVIYGGLALTAAYFLFFRRKHA